MVMISIQVVSAQEEFPLTIRLNRDFGYGSFSGTDIQGLFSIRAEGPENLVQVEFYIDDQILGVATAPPFKLQFDTGSFSLGLHTISATGSTSDGQDLQSNRIVRQFVSANESYQAAIKIIFPILGVILLAGIISWAIPSLFLRGKNQTLLPGVRRNYGPLGGTICPKCGRPFAIHIWGLNMMVGKIDRCPHCGMWSLVHRFNMESLRAAEKAELQAVDTQAPAVSQESEAERLRHELEKTRYQDL